MHWDMIAVMLAAMTGCSGFISWFVRSVVRDENAKQLIQINGTYVRSMLSTLTGAEIQRRLDDLSKEVAALGAYTHERIHAYANAIQVLQREQ